MSGIQIAGGIGATIVLAIAAWCWGIVARELLEQIKRHL